MSGLGRNNLIDASPSFSDSQDDSDEATQESWIEWWTHLKGNEFLCEVSEEFLRDEFNLYGFSAQVQPHSNHSHLGAVGIVESIFCLHVSLRYILFMHSLSFADTFLSLRH